MPEKLKDWKRASGNKTSVGSVTEAAAFGDLVVLAVKGIAAETIVQSISDDTTGQLVLDTSNPLADAEPVMVVIQF